MDKADQIAPGKAMLDDGYWPLANRSPHPPQDWLEADAMLIDGLITNDKFCVVRSSRLILSWARAQRRTSTARLSRPNSPRAVSFATERSLRRIG